jgi:hypothetical protein
MAQSYRPAIAEQERSLSAILLRKQQLKAHFALHFWVAVQQAPPPAFVA